MTVLEASGSQPYRITLEAGALARLGEITRDVAGSTRTLLASDSAIEHTHRPVALTALESAGLTVTGHELVALETHKSLETIGRLYESMLHGGLDRGSVVVALGGGIVGDTAGFAAATFLRGVPVVQVPTTLLAMVDASIGGKTGVNLTLPDDGSRALKLGKNLSGAFWQPAAVVMDPLVLATLAPREFRCGLAECIKHGLIADPGLLDFIETNLEEILGCAPDVVQTLVDRAVRVKLDVVAEDERETGPREKLNLGHTFAHAIEAIHDLELQHGEAVALGLVAATTCSVDMGLLAEEAAARVQRLIASTGLPCTLPRAVSVDELRGSMRYDKKVRDGRLRLVLPVDGTGARVIDDLPSAIIDAGWKAIGASD